MAMNLRNPIQLLRGTSAAIAAAQGKEGTLYYDTARNLLATSNGASLNYQVCVYNSVTNTPNIYVDSTNGDDNNSGFSSESPVKTLDKAIWLCKTLNSLVVPNIYMAKGEYTIGAYELPSCTLSGTGENSDSIIVYCSQFYTRNYIQVSNITVDIEVSDESKSAFYVVNGFLYMDNCKSNILANCSSVFDARANSYVFVSNTEINTNNIKCGTVIFADFVSAININYPSSFTGGASSTTAFAYAANSSTMDFDASLTFSGSYTGKRYLAVTGAIIFSHNSGANYLPGDAAGTTSYGGAYY